MIGAAVKARKKTISPDRAEPTPERMQIAGRDYELGDTGQITMRDIPLERAYRSGAITGEQYTAGLKYRHHWYHAGLSDAVGSIDLDRIFASDLSGFSGMAKTEQQVFHRQRYREATKAIGKTGALVLDWVICREVPLEQVGYSLGWGLKSEAVAAATERLRVALDQLDQIWG